MPYDDPNRDEDGEPLMDFDEDIQSDRDEPQQPFQDDEDDAGYDRSQRSPTPVYNDSKAKPRKRLIKKSSSGKETGPVDFGFDDDEGDVGGDYGGDEDDMAREKYSDSGKRKMDIGEKLKSLEKKRKGERVEKKIKVRKSGGERNRDHNEPDHETRETWDTVTGGDSEGVRTLDDEKFNDDEGVDPAHGYGSENEHSPSHAPEFHAHAFKLAVGWYWLYTAIIDLG